MNSLKQKILIGRIRRGDSEAFKEIYQIFSDRIYRFIFFRLPSESDAKDLLQETFLNLWNYLTTKDKKIENLQAFIYKIAKNLIANYYRENKVKKGEIGLDDVDYKIGNEDEKMIKSVDIKIKIKKIREQLVNLGNDEYREIIELKYLDELSHKEIATILEKSEENVRVLLHRAMRKLKSRINDLNEK